MLASFPKVPKTYRPKALTTELNRRFRLPHCHFTRHLKGTHATTGYRNDDETLLDHFLL